MVVTREWLVENYNKYNNLIFNGGLPSLERGQNQWVNFDLKVNNSRVYLGQFCQRKKALFGDMNYTIKISRYYDREEKDLINTLVHEMIHCYIAYNHIRDTSPHGVEFKRMMRKLNYQYGLNMSVRIPVNAKPSAPKNEEFYILAMETNDGRYFISNMNKSYMDNILASAARSHVAKQMKCFVSTNPRFQNWSKVRKLRGHQFKKDDYEKIYNDLKEKDKEILDYKK